MHEIEHSNSSTSAGRRVYNKAKYSRQQKGKASYIHRQYSMRVNPDEDKRFALVNYTVYVP